jgi:hypothetical protein
MYIFTYAIINYSIQEDHASSLKKDKKRKMTKKHKKEMLEIFKFQHNESSESEDDEQKEEECEIKKVRQYKKAISQSRKRKRFMKHNYLFTC